MTKNQPSSFRLVARRPPLLFVLLLAALLLGACFGPATRPGAEESDNRRGGGPQAGKIRGEGGLEIAYTLYGEGETLLVLVPGWGGNQGQWSSQVEDLAQRYTVVTVDLGGQGASGRGSRTSLAQLTQDLTAVLDAVGARRAILVGHSLGGVVALLAARERPHTVAGVIGVAAFAEPPPTPAVWQDLLGQLQADFPGGCRAFVRGLFASATEEPLVDESAEQICHLDPASGIALLRALAAFDLGKALAALPVSMPVRSIEATEELEVPETPPEEKLQRFHADFKTRIVPRSGHFPMLEQAAELTRQVAAAVKEIEAQAPRR